MEEIWKAIEGYEGLYEVSNMGRVRSLGQWKKNSKNGKYWLNGRVLKPGLGGNGYYFVCLYKDGSHRNHNIHRLVALAFVHNNDPINKPTVNHKNEVKTDNRAENLEWLSMKANLAYGTGRSRSIAAQKTKPIIQYDKAGNEVARYSGVNEAERQTGFSNTNISACCRGKYKQAYGFVWKYVEK